MNKSYFLHMGTSIKWNMFAGLYFGSNYTSRILVCGMKVMLLKIAVAIVAANSILQNKLRQHQ